MDTVFEVLNGTTITTFPQVSAAILYFHSVRMETYQAKLVAVSAKLFRGEWKVLIEVLEVRRLLAGDWE